MHLLNLFSNISKIDNHYHFIYFIKVTQIGFFENVYNKNKTKTFVSNSLIYLIKFSIVLIRMLLTELNNRGNVFSQIRLFQESLKTPRI
jgi:hypothetical protein